MPGGKLVTGELHVGGQAIVTSTSRMAEVARDLTLELQVQDTVGSRQNRARNRATTLDEDVMNLTSLLSRTEDLDVASALVELQERENVYQSALSVGSKVILPTLMDYLG
jgi:flagellar hook-associated protein 3 FlgL